MNKKPDMPNHETSNETPDEDFFQHYLQGKNSLSEHYRQTDEPMPSKRLDQAILTTARRQANKNHWWAHPGSWAATVAIISLVGVLAHNTWQTEEQASYTKPELEYQPQPVSKKAMPGDAVSESRETRQRPAKQVIIQADEKKDSRRLTYKSAPAPVLESAPNIPAEALSDSMLQEEDIEGISALSGMKAKEQASKIVSDKQQWLEHIEQLLQNNQLDEAQEQLSQFRKKHPDYPVDPVILEQLSP